MKIYFEDGQILPQSMLPFKYNHKIDAADGYSYCDDALYWICKNEPNSVVYTNALSALYNGYVWNEDLNVPELYIRPRANYKEFVRVDKLTNRELREGHNLMKMYMANEFGNF